MSDGTETANDRPAGDSTENEGAKFTDSDMAATRKSLDVKWQKRVDQATAKGGSSMLDDLGYDSVDDLKDALARVGKDATDNEETARANKKLLRDLESGKATYADLEAKHAKAVGEANSGKIQREIVAVAQRLNANSERLLDSRKVNEAFAVEDGSVVIRKDGEILHGMTAEKFIGQMVADDPSFKQPSPGRGSGTLPTHSVKSGNGKHEPGSREEAFELYQQQLAKTGAG